MLQESNTAFLGIYEKLDLIWKWGYNIDLVDVNVDVIFCVPFCKVDRLNKVNRNASTTITEI